MDFDTSADVLKGATAGLTAVGAIKEGSASARAARMAGKSAKKSGKFQAAQLRQQAGQVRAGSQRQSIEERRAARLAESRAVALAAASGAGAADPTIMKIVSNLAADGEYNALSALYEGEETARGLEMGATGAEYEGAAASQAYKMRGSAYRSAARSTAIGAALEGSASFLEKYGDGALTQAPTYRQPTFRPPGIR